MSCNLPLSVQQNSPKFMTPLVLVSGATTRGTKDSYMRIKTTGYGCIQLENGGRVALFLQ